MKENNKNWILLSIIIVLLVAIIAFVVVWKMGYINVNVAKNTQTQDSINNSTNNTKDDSTINLSTLVTQLINENKYLGKCPQGDCDIYYNVSLPKINLNTATVNKVNSEIRGLYDEVLEYAKNYSYIVYNISYTNGYSEELGYVNINIVDREINTHASGTTNYIDYIYDANNDKTVTVKDLLSKLNIKETQVLQALEVDPTFTSSDEDMLSFLKASVANFSDVHVTKLTDSSITLIAPCSPFDICTTTINY